MLFGTENALKNYEQFQHIMIGTANIKIVPVVRNLGVYIDSNLTMKNQISNTVKVCNHHLRNIAFIRKHLNEDTLKMLIHNHVISRLDYCNSVYHKLSNTLLKKLQNIQNRAARLIKKIPLRERITPALMELHWLPMKARIIYKICLLTYKALKFGEPKYLYEYLVPFELETSVTVTSRCSGERSFQYSAPRLYNKLPVEIKDSENINQFKKRLKTYLFGESYDMNQKTINEQYKI